MDGLSWIFFLAQLRAGWFFWAVNFGLKHDFHLSFSFIPLFLSSQVYLLGFWRLFFGKAFWFWAKTAQDSAPPVLKRTKKISLQKHKRFVFFLIPQVTVWNISGEIHCVSSLLLNPTYTAASNSPSLYHPPNSNFFWGGADHNQVWGPQVDKC